MKRFVTIFALIAAMPVFADDVSTPAVVARMTCDEINAEISALTSDENADADRLEKLHAEYRRNCTKRSVGRRVAGRSVDNVVPTQTVNDAPQPATDVNVADVPPADNTDTEPNVKNDDELTDAEIANLNSGLCRDGAKPNRFGCCAGEKFTDMGDLVFACCPAQGDCYPPMK